jgi:hypothetical protein
MSEYFSNVTPFKLIEYEQSIVYSFVLKSCRKQCYTKAGVYATNYNVLRIMSGMGGLAYIN